MTDVGPHSTCVSSQAIISPGSVAIHIHTLTEATQTQVTTAGPVCSNMVACCLPKVLFSIQSSPRARPSLNHQVKPASGLTKSADGGAGAGAAAAAGAASTGVGATVVSAGAGVATVSAGAGAATPQGAFHPKTPGAMATPGTPGSALYSDISTPDSTANVNVRGTRP